MRRDRWIYGTLTELLGVAVFIVVMERARRLVAWWVIAVVAAVWLAMSIALRSRPDDWGREGKYLDPWSIPHFMTGVLFGLLGIGAFWVVAIAITWELVEVFSRIDEHLTNRAVDVVLAGAGWAAITAVLGGTFALL